MLVYYRQDRDTKRSPRLRHRLGGLQTCLLTLALLLTNGCTEGWRGSVGVGRGKGGKGGGDGPAALSSNRR